MLTKAERQELVALRALEPEGQIIARLIELERKDAAAIQDRGWARKLRELGFQ